MSEGIDAFFILWTQSCTEQTSKRLCYGCPSFRTTYQLNLPCNSPVGSVLQPASDFASCASCLALYGSNLP